MGFAAAASRQVQVDPDGNMYVDKQKVVGETKAEMARRVAKQAVEQHGLAGKAAGEKGAEESLVTSKSHINTSLDPDAVEVLSVIRYK